MYFGLGYAAFFDGVSHSLVVHELWVLVVVGSNPTTPSRSPAPIAQLDRAAAF